MIAEPRHGLQKVPVPAGVAGAVNQHESSHRHLPPRGPSTPTGRPQHAKPLGMTNGLAHSLSQRRLAEFVEKVYTTA